MIFGQELFQRTREKKTGQFQGKGQVQGSANRAEDPPITEPSGAQGD